MHEELGASKSVMVMQHARVWLPLMDIVCRLTLLLPEVLLLWRYAGNIRASTTVPMGMPRR
jgi:hypothetical protein